MPVLVKNISIILLMFHIVGEVDKPYNSPLHISENRFKLMLSLNILFYIAVLQNSYMLKVCP